MTYGIIKSLHIISFTCWFAGLFYIVRLFVYNAENQARESNLAEAFHRQFCLMQHRLWYGITWPAMISTIVFGLWLVVLLGAIPPWLHVKFTLLAGLVAYHLLVGRIHRQITAGQSRWTSTGLRALNELATVFLVAIVFTAVLKSSLTINVAITVLVCFLILLAAGFGSYHIIRKRRSNENRESG